MSLSLWEEYVLKVCVCVCVCIKGVSVYLRVCIKIVCVLQSCVY
jgi:hypothetical protein